MQTGLLWYDDDPQRTLEVKIGRAADRYREKYGHLPDTCYVHPLAVAGLSEPADQPSALQMIVPLSSPVLPSASPVLPSPGPGRKASMAAANGKGTVRVISSPTILRHHFWLGESGGS